MILTKERAEKCVKRAGGVKDWTVMELKRAGFPVVDDTDPERPAQWNLKVHNEDGTMIRIYKTLQKKVEVQRWTPCIMKPSGIPTFEPSGRHSF